MVADADALVTLRLDVDLLDDAPNVRWVQALSAGVDSYPLAELGARDVALANAPGVHAEPIAEQVPGAMLSFERGSSSRRRTGPGKAGSASRAANFGGRPSG